MEKMVNIIVVPPFVASSEYILWGREAYRNITGINIVGIDEGRDPITYSDVELNVPGILNRIVLAEKEGYQAAIIGCFGDPGLIPARQLVSIPVIGPGETSLAIASILGDRILILEPSEEFVYPTERMVYSYGHRDRVVDVRSIEVPLETCITLTKEEKENAAEVILKAVKNTDARVVIFGCIGLFGIVNDLNRLFKEKRISVPIVEPGIVAMNYTKMLLNLGLNQSREMFPK